SSPNPDPDTLASFPAALPRADFRIPPSEFSPATYLSTLHNRHQTLSDLRSDLRARSQLIARELLDLVNANYADFLSLGAALRGGEDRVEEVRVGLLGFRGAVEGVRGKVADREGEVEVLVEERRRVRAEREKARALLDVHRRLGELESGLMVGSGVKHAEAGSDSESDTEEEDEDDGQGGEDEPAGLARLRRLVRQYLVVRQLVQRVGPEHPFLVTQESRMMKVRNTLLLDLGAALKQAKSTGPSGQGRVLKTMAIYAEMDESAEAVKVLRGNS
ncbi:hypothetical protein K490DRAFT_34671, partial [Saccharata proteae CBS 121410]